MSYVLGPKTASLLCQIGSKTASKSFFAGLWSNAFSILSAGIVDWKSIEHFFKIQPLFNDKVVQKKEFFFFYSFTYSSSILYFKFEVSVFNSLLDKIKL